MNIDTQIYLIWFLLLLILAIPIFIYFYYIRKPKIDYDAEYETDLPTDDPPAIVNAVCAGDREIIGVPNIDGFRATILDLIDRKYIFLKSESSEGHLKNLSLKINHDKDISDLWEFEKQVLDFLKKHEYHGVISMNLISYCLDYLDNNGLSISYDEWHNEFENNLDEYKNWKMEVEETLVDGKNFNDAFISKRHKYLKIFGVFGTIIAWGFIFYHAFFTLFSQTIILLALILWLESIIIFLIPGRINYRWTPYGLEYYKKWMNFKRYIEDFSLIKEDPPESVKIWDQYLVYATALGVGDGVRKAM
ncbi:MAG TPA: DUF2207 domain-containing protein, partial [Methanobacterium sp.]|nr:DUF2207 domain-containing protein [Methanobacterium sp.]